jgi:hypothetical protein
VLSVSIYFASDRHPAAAAAATACADVTAAENFMVFQFAWMADPLYFGDYPAVSAAD